MLPLLLIMFIINNTSASNVTKEQPWLEFNSFASDVWTEGMDVARVLWKECSKRLLYRNNTYVHQDHFSVLVKCAKKKTLKALDRTLGSDVISLGSGIQLVKYEKVGKDGKITKQQQAHGNETERAAVENLYENGDWKMLVLEKMASVFKTHVLKLDIHEDKPEIEESRHRRRHQMMQMMMFGITSMGMILVPMGFQFLAVLGGKALLLAKLALILSSIQGLKKIATSPINYGLYHTFSPYEGHVEKRGYASPAKPEGWSFAEEAIGRSSDQEKLKYKYDSDSRLWKPEPYKPAKRSYYNLGNSPSVYPVYPVSPHEVNYVPASGYLASSPDVYEAPSTEVHAEYTIDLPVNKVQFKSTAPFLQK